MTGVSPGVLTFLLLGFVLIGTAFDSAEPVVIGLLILILVGLLLEGTTQINQSLSYLLTGKTQ